MLTAHPDGLDLYDLATFWIDPTPTRHWPNATTSAAVAGRADFVVGGQDGEVIKSLGSADHGAEETVVLSGEPVQVITQAPDPLRAAGRRSVGERCASTCTPTPPPRDGTLTPAERHRAAAAAGLDVVALTDHDSVAGWARAAAAAGRPASSWCPA